MAGRAFTPQVKVTSNRSRNQSISISHDIKQTGCNPKSCDQAYPYARMEGFTTPRDKLYGRTPLWEASSFGHISVIRSRMKERQMSLWRSPIIGLFQRVKKRPTYVPTHLPVCGVSGSIRIRRPGVPEAVEASDPVTCISLLYDRLVN